MKLTLPQATLLESLKRGGFASLSDEAQTDNSSLSLLVKSIKMRAEKTGIVFESATSLLASKYVLPITEDVSIKEEGEVMVPAKEFYDWVNRQGDCTVGLASKDLKTPELLNASGEAESATKAAIKKVGSLGMVSKDKSKTGSKWSLDSLDSSHIPMIDFDLDVDPLFIMPLEQLTEGIKHIGFTSMPKDPEHLFDTISFQHKDEKMYLVATDCARCAVYHVPNADKIKLESTLTVKQIEETGMKDAWKHNLLVPSKFLNEVCKLSSNVTPLSFHRDEGKNRIYLSQPGFVVRMSTAEKDVIEKFPPIDLFLTKKYKDLCVVPSNVLASRLNTVSLVNKNAILFSFENDELTLQGISESGHAPCKANLSVPNLSSNFKKVWNVKHFSDILKAVGNGDIKIEVADDKDQDSVKILNPDNANVAYYAMAVERSKYNLDD